VSRSGELFLGLDAGTSGVRAAVVSPEGKLMAEAAVPIAPAAISRSADRHEQQPEAWWDAARKAIGAALEQLEKHPQAGRAKHRLAALAIDGTSGTIVPVGRAAEPVAAALMYDDPRAGQQAAELNDLATETCQKLGYRFGASFALAKILWIKHHQPALFDRAARFVHQADYLQERLTGTMAISDWSNALKTGFDLLDCRWPEWIEKLLPASDKLPQVVAPGTPVGRVCARAAQQTGLPKGLCVVAGATDGTTAFLASGVRQPGDWNTTLGTTLVFKGLSERLCRDPQGRIYCHRLPGGWWLPGAAANTGARWIERWFPGHDPAELDAAARAHLPADQAVWPLAGRGERFPFVQPEAEGFGPPEGLPAAKRYAACLVGVALFERLCYQALDCAMERPAQRPTPKPGGLQAGGSALGGSTVWPGSSGRLGRVYTTGTASRSNIWAQVRADVTGRVLHRPACPQSVFGSAVLAACGMIRGGLWETVDRMVRIERIFEPRAAYQARYDELFQRFCEQLVRRGWL